MNKPRLEDKDKVATVYNSKGEVCETFAFRDHGNSYLSAAQNYLMQNYDKLMAESVNLDEGIRKRLEKEKPPQEAIDAILAKHGEGKIDYDWGHHNGVYCDISHTSKPKKGSPEHDKMFKHEQTFRYRPGENIIKHVGSAGIGAPGDTRDYYRDIEDANPNKNVRWNSNKALEEEVEQMHEAAVPGTKEHLEKLVGDYNDAAKQYHYARENGTGKEDKHLQNLAGFADLQNLRHKEAEIHKHYGHLKDGEGRPLRRAGISSYDTSNPKKFANSWLAEEVEQMDEAKHKLNDPVEIVRGPRKGTKGHIGEIRRGPYKGAPERYTVFHDEHGATQVGKEHIRKIKEEVEQMDEALVAESAVEGFKNGIIRRLHNMTHPESGKPYMIHVLVKHGFDKVKDAVNSAAEFHGDGAEEIGSSDITAATNSALSHLGEKPLEEEVKKVSPKLRAAVAGLVGGAIGNYSKFLWRKLNPGNPNAKSPLNITIGAGLAATAVHRVSKAHNAMVDKLHQHKIGSEVEAEHQDGRIRGTVIDHTIEGGQPLVHIKDDNDDVTKVHVDNVIKKPTEKQLKNVAKAKQKEQKALPAPAKQKALPAPNTLQEKLTSDMPLADVIRDFVHSDNKRFKGKSKEERIDMAKGAYYDMHENKIYTNIISKLEEGRNATPPKPGKKPSAAWLRHLERQKASDGKEPEKKKEPEHIVAQILKHQDYGYKDHEYAFHDGSTLNVTPEKRDKIIRKIQSLTGPGKSPEAREKLYSELNTRKGFLHHTGDEPIPAEKRHPMSAQKR